MEGMVSQGVCVVRQAPVMCNDGSANSSGCMVYMLQYDCWFSDVLCSRDLEGRGGHRERGQCPRMAEK